MAEKDMRTYCVVGGMRILNEDMRMSFDGLSHCYV